MYLLFLTYLIVNQIHKIINQQNKENCCINRYKCLVHNDRLRIKLEYYSNKKCDDRLKQLIICSSLYKRLHEYMKFSILVI